ncbi:hypothetical protein V5F53_13855 [Xanthobacter sp. V4C-4]|uniref:hypothetical protein n=1 Tax=Xanthobacter cornucopiae TaxID=3119924 RepID=UPI00372803FF
MPLVKELIYINFFGISCCLSDACPVSDSLRRWRPGAAVGALSHPPAAVWGSGKTFFASRLAKAAGRGPEPWAAAAAVFAGFLLCDIRLRQSPCMTTALAPAQAVRRRHVPRSVVRDHSET